MRNYLKKTVALITAMVTTLGCSSMAMAGGFRLNASGYLSELTPTSATIRFELDDEQEQGFGWTKNEEDEKKIEGAYLKFDFSKEINDINISNKNFISEDEGAELTNPLGFINFIVEDGTEVTISTSDGMGFFIREESPLGFGMTSELKSLDEIEINKNIRTMVYAGNNMYTSEGGTITNETVPLSDNHSFIAKIAESKSDKERAYASYKIKEFSELMLIPSEGIFSDFSFAVTPYEGDRESSIYDVIKEFNGDITESESRKPNEPEITVSRTNSTVLIDGKNTAFQSYNINGYNYFKLRDIAMALNGTDKNFEVGWDAEKGAIGITKGKAYTVVGGEMNISSSNNTNAVKSNATLYVDGVKTELDAYTIDGNTYFQLRDIGKFIDFGVIWDSTQNAIKIDTSVGYSS